MSYHEEDIAHETATHWVLRKPRDVFEVYRIGVTHSTRVALYAIGPEGRARAIADCNRRHEAQQGA